MTTPLTPLSAFTITNPEANAVSRTGGPASPPAANPNQNYPWEVAPGVPHGPYGAEAGLIGVDIVSYETPAGYLAQDPTGDQQPVTHATPWPKGINQAVNDAVATGQELQTSADIHASNFGLSRAMNYTPTMRPRNDSWEAFERDDPGSTIQVPIPAQVMTGSGGFGSRDRTQSMAPQNQYGFDTAHIFRRFATGKIPGNELWMRPGSRPLIVPLVQNGVVPNAADGPFAGQDPSIAFGTQGSVLTDTPVAYIPTNPPATVPAYSSVQAAPAVDLW